MSNPYSGTAITGPPLGGALRRQCYIHIGPPKTGTSALQTALATAAAELKRCGFLYPRTGRTAPDGGHQALAWELAGFDRGIVRTPLIEQFAAEIATYDGSIILSCEHFAYAVFHGDAFANFVRLLQQQNFDVIAVVYLRDQLSYLTSTYLQFVLTGYAECFEAFLSQALSKSPCRLRGYSFSFDHLELLNRLRAMERLKISARGYDKAANAVCSDFLSLLGLDLHAIGLTTEPSTNVRQPVKSYVLSFLESRLHRALRGREIQAVDALLPSTVDERLDVSDQARRRIAERFSDSNARAALDYGIAPISFANTARGEAQAEWMTMDGLFSDAFQTAIVARSRLHDAAALPAPSQSPALRRIARGRRMAAAHWHFLRAHIARTRRVSAPKIR